MRLSPSSYIYTVKIVIQRNLWLFKEFPFDEAWLHLKKELSRCLCVKVITNQKLGKQNPFWFKMLSDYEMKVRNQKPDKGIVI